MTVYSEFLGRLNQLIMTAEAGADLPLEELRDHTRDGWGRNDLTEWQRHPGPGLGELFELLYSGHEPDITLDAIVELHLKMVHHLKEHPALANRKPTSARIDLLDRLERVIWEERNRSEGAGRFVRKDRLQAWFHRAKGLPDGFGPACGQLHAAVHNPGRVKCGDAQIWLSEMYQYVRRQEAKRLPADDMLLTTVSQAFDTLDPVPPEVIERSQRVFIEAMERRGQALAMLRKALKKQHKVDIMPDGVLDPDAVKKVVKRLGSRESKSRKKAKKKAKKKRK